MTAAMQAISYAMVANTLKCARGRPKGFIRDKPSTATGAPSEHRAQRCWVRQVDAGDTDDGLGRDLADL
jgi:hypothetical protein